MKLTASSELMRAINRSAVLDCIRERGPLSRAQLSRTTGVSASTVMRIVDELAAEHLVVSVGSAESSLGRPGELVDFNHQGFAVIAIDLGGTKIYGAVTDLAGTIQHEVTVASSTSNHPEESIQRLVELIDKLLAAPRPANQVVMGIGVGAPGLTYSDEGVVALAPGLGWKDLPLKQILSNRFNLPVFVENDVNLAALGEYGYGIARGCKNMVSIFIGTGIGAGIIIGGALYRGHSSAAGEIGYMVPSVKSLGRVYDGFGALEDVASGTGVASQARQYFQAAGLPEPPEAFSARDVFEAARKGEAWAQNIVRDTVDYLTVAIANVNSLLNPELVVLSGGLMESADVLFEPVRARLQGLMPNLPRLEVSALGPRATVLGATMLVLTAVTGSTAVKQLP